MSKAVYKIIADRIIESLDQGIIPWRKPWHEQGLPKNGIRNKAYRGINIWLLNSTHFQNPNWFTYKEVEKIGANVRKGEKGYPVIFWQMIKKEMTAEGGVVVMGSNGQPKVSIIPLLRYYTVFNAEQCDNLPEKYFVKTQKPMNHNPIEEAEGIFKGMPSKPVVVTGDTACYRQLIDTVEIPSMTKFAKVEQYYSVLFHELAHSTMHPSRLDRKMKDSKFGSQDYGREELLAEFSASYLCGVAGIENTTLTNSTAYIQNWMKAINEDNSMIVFAAAQAQKASDFILGVKEEIPEA